MARLTVIADDLTGALDTGVQFANRCVSVRVAAVNAAAVPEEIFHADVAVIDAEQTPFTSKRTLVCGATSAPCFRRRWMPAVRRLHTMHRHCRR